MPVVQWYASTASPLEHALQFSHCYEKKNGSQLPHLSALQNDPEAQDLLETYSLTRKQLQPQFGHWHHHGGPPSAEASAHGDAQVFATVEPRV